MTSDAFDAAAEQPRLELVVSSALYLMSAYGRNGGCPQMAAMIVRHLDAIAERDDAPAVLRSSCANLGDQWECLRRQAQQEGKARGFLKSMFRGHHHQKQEITCTDTLQTATDQDMTGDPSLHSLCSHVASPVSRWR